MTDEQPVHVYELYVNAPAERVWQAIVDGDMTTQYYYGTRVQSTWEPGAEVLYLYPDGSKASDGEILAIEPPRYLEMTFRPLWDPKLTEEGATREIWRIEEQGEMCKLSCELYDIDPDGAIMRDFASGIVYILSGLKTLVETGRPLAAPGPSGEG